MDLLSIINIAAACINVGMFFWLRKRTIRSK
jgi:hypothetical protein